MKLKDIPNNTFFQYDSERAKTTIGPNISYRDMYFKLESFDTKNVKIIHIPNKIGRITETILGNNTNVELEKRDNWINKRAILIIFSGNYHISYKIKYSIPV